MERTIDSLWCGKLVLAQPARGCGYRYNLDPVLLAGFVGPAEHIVDLGAGVGVLGILLLASGKAKRVTAIEIQPELAELADENAAANGLRGRMRVIAGDFRSVSDLRAEAVVFNPPYYRASEGKGAPERGRDAARHERYGTLADFIHFAAATVAGRGHIAAVLPARRGPELEQLLRRVRPSQLRRRLVVPRPGVRPGHWLMEARLDGSHADGSVADLVELPLVVHTGAGRAFSAEVQALLREDLPLTGGGVPAGAGT